MIVTEYKNSRGTFWHVRGYLGIDEATGKDVEFNKRGFKTSKAAKIAYTRAKNQFYEGTYEKAKHQDKLTYRDVYDQWIVLYRDTVKESTVCKHEKRFEQHILPIFGKYRVNKITTNMLQKQLNEWHKKYSTYKRFYNLTCKVLSYALLRGYIDSNPMDQIVMPIKEIDYETTYDREKSFYTKNELKDVLKAIKDQDNLRWYAFFRLLAFSGIRRGEALSLTWDNINFQEKTLSVTTTLAQGYKNKLVIQSPKTSNSIRTITLDDKTLSILSSWRMKQRTLLLRFGHNANKPSQLVFSKYEKNTPLDPSSPRNYFERVCRLNDLEFINIHGFRHTHCSLLFDAGVPMKDVKDRLGHADIQTTMNIYTHVTQESKDTSAELFAKYANF